MCHTLDDKKLFKLISYNSTYHIHKFYNNQIGWYGGKLYVREYTKFHYHLKLQYNQDFVTLSAFRLSPGQHSMDLM